MCALSYAHDITNLSPSIAGFIEMLQICHIFADKNSIIFNSKKTVCIKFGDNVVRNEEAYGQVNGQIVGVSEKNSTFRSYCCRY